MKYRFQDSCAQCAQNIHQSNLAISMSWFKCLLTRVFATRLLSIQRCLIPFVFFLAFNQSEARVTQLTDIHFHIEEYFKSVDVAEVACANFAISHGYSHPGACHFGSINEQQGWEAGNLCEQNYPIETVPDFI